MALIHDRYAVGAYISMASLKKGDRCFTYDGWYDLVEIVEPIHYSERYGFDCVTVVFINKDTDLPEPLETADEIGGIDAYCPSFFSVVNK